MRRVALVTMAFAVMSAATVSHAHEVRPGYLELRQTGEEAFEVIWKVPARGDLRLSLHARLPESCRSVAPVSRYLVGSAYVDRWTVTCPGGLAGQTIGVDGLSATLTDVLVRVERSGGTTQVARLTPSAPTFVVEAAPDSMGIASTYLMLGVEHILLGIDHLLFVLALLMLVEGRRRLIWTVTAFTLAHSLTLAAATLGFVHVPQRPVEAIIALSIVFVAGEIVHARRGSPGATQRWPWLVAFTFGLLHGFGFAGALAEVGLPQQAIPLALLFFNVGVEVGQLLFIGAALLLAALAGRIQIPSPAWAGTLPAYGIGSVATYWTIERVVGFWP